MINIIGTLTDPMQGSLPFAHIRLTALSTTGEVLEGMGASHKTSASGAYSFTLEEGRYLLEVLYTDEFHISGQVLVDSSTPSNITLQELIKYASPVVAPISSELPTDWATLLADTVTSDEWNSKDEHQVRLDTTYSNEQKSIHKKGEQYLSTEDFSLTAGTSTQQTQLLSYTDNLNNHAVAQTQEFNTPILQGVNTFGIFQSSNGEESLEESSTLTGSVGSVSSGSSVTDLTTIQSTSSALGSSQSDQTLILDQDVAITEGSLKAGAGIHTGELYSKDEVKFDSTVGLVGATLEKGIRLSYTQGEVGSTVPVEGFQSLTASSTGVDLVTQTSKSTIQGLDGVRLAEFDTETNEINLFGKLTVSNPEDFKGDDGTTLDWTFQYSSDKGVGDAWHDVYDTAHGDVWRKDTQVTLFTDGTRIPTGVVQYVKLSAEDGAAGDQYYLNTVYATHEGKLLDIWHSTYTVGDDWRRQREFRTGVNGVVVGSWWEPERIGGDNGRDGWIPEFEIYYGAEGTAVFEPEAPDLSLWHKNLVNEDIFKYERTIWWYSREAYAAAHPQVGGRYTDAIFPLNWSLAESGTYATTPWTGPTKIKPEAGVDYGDKTFPLFLYTRAADNPTDSTVGDWSYDFVTKTATNISGNTANWSQQLPPEGDEPLWVATGVAFSKTDIDPSIDNWDVDLMSKNGVKFAIAKLYQLTGSDITSVTLPIGEHTFTFSSQKITSLPSGNWQTTYPTNYVEGGKVWATVAPVTAAAEDLTEVIAANAWETAVVLSSNSFSIFKSTVFKRSSTSLTNSVPTGGSFTSPLPTSPAGWEDGIPSGEEQLWGSTRIFTSTEEAPHQTVWTTPVAMTDTASIDYEWSVSGIGNPTTNPTEWGNASDLNTIYMAVRTKSNGVWSTWQISKIKGEKGDAGVSITGAAGLHGSGSYVITTAAATTKATVLAYTQAVKDGHFTTISGRAPQNKDILSYVNDTATDETLRFRVDYLYNGTDWVEFIDVVNGNQIVHGTVAAEHLVANTITADKIAAGAITADEILANTITADRIVSNVTFGVDATFTGTLKIGNTSLTDVNTINSNNTAASVGADALGSAAAAEAAAIATAATNSNSADKTSGTLGSWNIKTGYIYSGAVNTEQTANAYSSSGMTLSSAGAIRSPNFRVDSDGSAYFKGDISLATGTLTAASIKAENIDGDVYDANTYGYVGSYTILNSSSHEITIFSGNVATGTFTRKLKVGAMELKIVADAKAEEIAKVDVYLRLYVDSVLKMTTSSRKYWDDGDSTATLEYNTFNEMLANIPIKGSDTSFEVRAVIDRDANHYSYPILTQTGDSVVALFKEGGALS